MALARGKHYLRSARRWKGCESGGCEYYGKEKDNEADGHHGLQGMRERVATLGGEVEAGPAETGGFTVTLRLPFESLNEICAEEVK